MSFIFSFPKGISRSVKVRRLTTKGTALTTKEAHQTVKESSFPAKGTPLTTKESH